MTEIDTSNYVQWTEDMIHLQERIDHKLVKLQKGHWTQSINAIAHTLFYMYGETSMESLHKRSEYSKECEKFSHALNKYFNMKKSSNNTRGVLIHSIKKILSHTGINPVFINRITLIKEEKVVNPLMKCIPGKFKKLDDNHDGKRILLQWVEKTNNIIGYSPKTTLVFFHFICHLLDCLECPVENMNNDKLDFLKNISFTDLKEGVLKTTLKTRQKIKINYTQKFFIDIVENSKLKIEDFKYWSSQTKTPKKTLQPDNDIHRIKIEELEKMYKVASQNIRDELMFMLLITTGMRVGGLSNIKVDYVSKVVGNELVILDTGKTIEKGMKWFSFAINKRVKELLHFWITCHRPPKNDYLFPSRRGNKGLSINRINGLMKEIGKKAGITGKHIHPHAFRHTYAHMLLEMGNRPELVSKMLGHSSTATTEQYYLKESAVEASKRANIPWLEKNENQKIIPDFLEKEKVVNKRKQKENKKVNKAVLKTLLKGINKP